MLERKPTRKKEARVTPFLRTELSWLEGVRIENGVKSVTLRALHENQVAVVESVEGREGKADVFQLPTGETYQHEIVDGTVFSVQGGDDKLGKRRFDLYVPLNLKVVRLVHRQGEPNNGKIGN